ncbi:MAG: hypothetical protein DKINENOH_05382 [bacterium]|nr:hypothetical protein [bacterium]
MKIYYVTFFCFIFGATTEGLSVQDKPPVAQSQRDSGHQATKQEKIDDSGRMIANPPPVVESAKPLSLTKQSFYLSIGVLLFGLSVLIIELVLIAKQKINPEDTVRCIVVTLIILGALFLITAGYSNDQIAPAIGLLGTIAGYLLGKSSGGEKQ